MGLQVGIDRTSYHYGDEEREKGEAGLHLITVHLANVPSSAALAQPTSEKAQSIADSG